MGAYLSEPVTEKVSIDESNDKLEYGASSMQGWRVNQEDAHNAILDYDTNTSLFAVYDGHGGAEVAAYCAQNLPDYIKNTDAYKRGDIVQALEDAFLGFDATIITKEVMETLKELAGEINIPAPSDNEESDYDENFSNLYQEAKLPLQEVLAKYENQLSSIHRARLGDAATPLSPCLRAKSDDVAGGSGAGASSSSAGSSLATAGSSSELAGDVGSASGSNGIAAKCDDDAGGVSSTGGTGEKDVNGEVSTSKPATESPNEVAMPNSAAPDSSADNCLEPQQSGSGQAASGACSASGSAQLSSNSSGNICNGETPDSKQAEPEGNISSSNGSGSGAPVIPEKSKGNDSPAVSSSDKEPERKKSNMRRATAAVYESLLQQSDEDDDDDSDDDETFEGGEERSSDEDVNGVEDSEEEEEDDEEEEENDEDEDEAESSDEAEGDEALVLTEEPGNDSGCTAVVALIKGNELYVGNAGDSRCIICRDGTAIEMSEDHKPEDEPEMGRITNAGGRVSNDGRINGGLNLSRAIGDHCYKQNKDLGPKDQMITAHPDVKTLTIDPVKDQFMVLACDGIWNFMSSQDVCNFILPRLAEGRERLSQICEEMFDHCLAPSTMGDGTGCDNMTAIIVCFKDGLVAEVAQHTGGPMKRAAEEEPSLDTPQEAKRQKTDDSLSSSIVTSSV